MTNAQNSGSPSRREIVFAAIGAVGGASLTTISSMWIEDHKSANTLREQVELKRMADEGQATLDRRKGLENLAASFDDLGDITRRAAEYAETGKVGSVDDVRALFRHFRRVVRFIKRGSASAEEISQYYGMGQLAGWAKRFGQLSDGSAPKSSSFSAYERYNFGVLSQALVALTGDDALDIDEAMNAHDMGENDTSNIE